MYIRIWFDIDPLGSFTVYTKPVPTGVAKKDSYRLFKHLRENTANMVTGCEKQNVMSPYNFSFQDNKMRWNLMTKKKSKKSRRYR